MDRSYFSTKLLAGQDLNYHEARAFYDVLSSPSTSPVQVASLLTAFTVKGETIDEIIGLISRMRETMIKLNIQGHVFDTCGTGGDKSDSFNISTVVGLVMAGLDISVAKHGNKAASSKCGSADVLEALGANISLSKQDATAILHRVGFVFLFAPMFHPTLKPLGPIRKELGFRTIFNLLGPFCNPASPKRQIIGVPSKAIARVMAEVATQLNYERLVIVVNEHGLDEVGLEGTNYLYEVNGQNLRALTFESKTYGLKEAAKDKLKGGTPLENAAILMGVLQGKKNTYRDAVLINAAVACKVAGLATTIPQGLTLAQRALDSGSALAKLSAYIELSNSFKK